MMELTNRAQLDSAAPILPPLPPARRSLSRAERAVAFRVAERAKYRAINQAIARQEAFAAARARFAYRLEHVAHLDRRPTVPHYAPAVKKAAPRADRAAAFRESERAKFRAANKATVGDVRTRFAARQATLPRTRRPLHSPKL